MFRAIAEIFNGLLTQTSIFGAVIAVAALIALASLAYYAKTSIDIRKRESEKKLEILVKRAEDKDAQQKALVEEIRQSRVQMIDHMNRDRREKDRLTRTLGSMVAEIRAQGKVVDSIKMSVDSQREKIIEKISELKEEVIRAKD